MLDVLDRLTAIVVAQVLKRGRKSDEFPVSINHIGARQLGHGAGVPIDGQRSPGHVFQQFLGDDVVRHDDDSLGQRLARF